MQNYAYFALVNEIRKYDPSLASETIFFFHLHFFSSRETHVYVFSFFEKVDTPCHEPYDASAVDKLGSVMRTNVWQLK